MKKIIGVLAVSLIFTTLGCNNPGSSNRKYNDHFKEYTFKGTLNQEERTKLEAGLQKSALTVSSVKAKNESYTKNGFTERSQTSEGTLKICEDPSNKNLFVSSTSYTSNSSSKENGITLKQNIKIESKEWDAGSGYRFVTTETNTNDLKESNTDAFEQSVDSAKYKETKIKRSVSLPTSSTYYFNNDGTYTVINSQMSKNVSAVQWGNGTKEYVTSSKSQTVYSINKNYQLTSYYTYDESSANRDPSTGEWFDGEQIISSSYTSTEYRYEKKDVLTIDSLNKSIATKKIPLSASINYYTANVEPLGNTYYVRDSGVAGVIDNISIISSDNQIYQCRFGSRINGAPSYASSSYYAQRFEAVVKMLTGHKDISTKSYNLVLADNFSNKAPDIIETINVDGNTYFINKDYYANTVSFTGTFDGTKVVVNSISV